MLLFLARVDARLWHFQRLALPESLPKNLNLVHKLHLRHEHYFVASRNTASSRLLAETAVCHGPAFECSLNLLGKGTLHSVLFNLHSQQISTMDRAEHSKQYLYLYYLFNLDLQLTQ